MTLGKLREPLCPSVQQLTLGSPVAHSEGQGRFTGPHSQGSEMRWCCFVSSYLNLVGGQVPDIESPEK